MPTDRLHLTIVLRKDLTTSQEAMEVHAAFQDGEYEDTRLQPWEDQKMYILDGLPRPVTITSGKQTIELVPAEPEE